LTRDEKSEEGQLSLAFIQSHKLGLYEMEQFQVIDDNQF
jgi:hypothetical protein